ncbi:MAG: leucyl aminopeptidase [Patescibacteria group bacterium]|nr:leucyl aminopeptidase [Patescibacteria group bacterium]
MEFEFSDNALSKISADAIIVFAFQNEKGKTEKYQPLADFLILDKELKGVLSKSSMVSKFAAKRGEMLNIFPQSGVLASWIVIVGLGKKNEFVANDLRLALGRFAGAMNKKIDSVALSLPLDADTSFLASAVAQLVGEGLVLGSYGFNKYQAKEEKGEKKLSTVIISKASAKQNVKKEVRKGIEKAKLYSQATILARDLVNEQASVATPTFLAELALSIAGKDKNISCKIYDKAQAEKLGMGAFLGIAKASATPPKFIHLEYKPEKAHSANSGQANKERLAIVGKGITFDSGGINVKTGDSMVDMKIDMSGAAIVLAVFSVISAIKPGFPVIGLIAATPNLISGTSIVPGDVVKALNGKTIEVLNTDAEGRVTLADSLSFAVKQGASKILDFATLTGACHVALGDDITGLFSNSRTLAEEVKKAAFSAGEKMWELPLEKEYKEMNKSEVADIANIPSSRYGGAITAALFLQEFVDGKPWVHMDIAGPAFSSKITDLGPKGGTGYGVRTVLNLLS